MRGQGKSREVAGHPIKCCLWILRNCDAKVERGDEELLVQVLLGPPKVQAQHLHIVDLISFDRSRRPGMKLNR